METNGQTRTIGRSLLISITIAVIAICVGLGTVGYRTFSNGMTDHYQVYLRDLLNMTSTRIDGDDLAACIESGQESEAFKEADAYLDAVKETHNIEYVYIVVPLNDEAVANCKAHGIKINVWTVNDMAGLEKLYAWDVEGIITNFPSVPMAWLAARRN